EYRAALSEAEAQARKFVDDYISGQEQGVRTGRDEALRELTAVRDEFGDLLAEGSSGRLPAAEYADRLNELRARQAQAEAQLQQAEEKVAQIEKVETDPIGYYDQQAARFQHLRVEVPW